MGVPLLISALRFYYSWATNKEISMKRFWGFVIKEFYHIFRDYRTLLILFGMPAVQLLLFGYVHHQ